MKSKFGLNPSQGLCMFEDRTSSFLWNSIKDISESEGLQILLIVNPGTGIKRNRKEKENFIIEVSSIGDISHRKPHPTIYRHASFAPFLPRIHHPLKEANRVFEKIC
jgi:hypothetical protein